MESEAQITTPAIVCLADLDTDALLALNNSHAIELSPLEKPQLDALIRMAYYARGVGPARAFLIALDQDAHYDNWNFQWFRKRYSHFIYIDRVVVDSHYRGLGIAQALYFDLLEQAKAQSRDLIVCEVNQDPPNPASDEFHQKMGFIKVGESLIPAGKRVNYLAKHRASSDWILPRE